MGEFLALRHTRWFNVGRRCRFHWVALRSRHWRLLVDAAVGECPAISVALKRHPVIFRPLVTRFLTADSTLQDRFHAFAHDLAFTATRIHRSFPDFLMGSSKQLLWSECGYAIELALNVDSPQEGLWRIDLKDGSDHRVFTASFSVLPDAVMFIGAMQGGSVIEGTDPRASVRAATKHFSGLRPQCLLLQVLRCIASAWRIRTIVGVSDKQQVTLRSERGSRASITFSYDGYFLEAGARPSICGNWHVPLEHAAREPESIPSRKRSMYRRRQGQIQQLECQIAAQLR
ncbi:MAG: DUF535 family protein [Gammaproteobacteria bacterium]|nr:DUF535 family protein [Gammaproteobacteria bacterium]